MVIIGDKKVIDFLLSNPISQSTGYLRVATDVGHFLDRWVRWPNAVDADRDLLRKILRLEIGGDQ
jgi:hypothetical protein